jgi:hypothetical protein
MTETTLTDAVEAFAADHEGKSVPSPSTDPVEIIKSQLTENTGTHFLDSGGAYGRHWEENQENPPWEKPTFTVRDQYVTENVYNHMQRTLGRDEMCVSLEIALYAFGYSEEYSSTSWLPTTENFVDLLDGAFYTPEFAEEYGLPVVVANDIAGFAADFDGDTRPFTFNTYNSEFGELTQCLQGAALGGGPYAEYWAIQVHQGCDIRGGYTAPRVYRSEYTTPMTHEREFHCEVCDWYEAESVLYGNPDLHYFTGPVDAFDLENAGLVDDGEDAAVLRDVDRADHIDGAIIHDCPDHDGLGHVHP